MASRVAHITVKIGDLPAVKTWMAAAVAAAKAEGRAEQRAADIAALRDESSEAQNRYFAWVEETTKAGRFVAWGARQAVADYLEHLGAPPTEEAGG
jgi:RecB family endonuclease NucS